VLFTIARAIAWGKRTALLTVLGNVTGMYLVSFLVALGLGPILSHSHAAYLGVQIAGGLYLAYLGAQALRERAEHSTQLQMQPNDRPSDTSIIRQGFVVGFLNPKSVVFFAAILPQFTDPARGHLTGQLIFLGSCFAIIAVISDGSWGLIAGTIRQWLSADVKRLIRLRTIGGTVMIGLGFFTLINAFVRH
jgi:threonine/homoserine/homoserine lactone efflux protein